LIVVVVEWKGGVTHGRMAGIEGMTEEREQPEENPKNPNEQ
jgi:hypothetical protein